MSPAASPVPASPVPGGAKPVDRRRGTQLSTTQIVDAALRIITAHGVDGLSMRGLSRELQVSAMAPYYYVDDKDGLLELVVEAILSAVDVHTPATDPWDIRLRTLVDRIDEQLRQHRGIAPLLLERMLAGHRPVLEAVMSLLSEAGFDERGVLMAFALLHTYLYGRHQVTMIAPPVGTDGELTPVIGRITRHLDEVSGRDYYRFGVDAVIAGLMAQLAASEAATDSRPAARRARPGAVRSGRSRAAP